MSWLDNDKLAREMFATGHAFELVVAAFFRAHGLAVDVNLTNVLIRVVHALQQRRPDIAVQDVF